MTRRDGLCDQQVCEAEESLRAIRAIMDRSTRFATFSGMSGVCAGLLAITGAAVTRIACGNNPAKPRDNAAFAAIWITVAILAAASDFVAFKWRSRIDGTGRWPHCAQAALAAAPSLVVGSALAIELLRFHLMWVCYPVWMLCYGAALSAAGHYSQVRVRRLGFGFTIAGIVTLLLPPSAALYMMALTFGGLHILYGAVTGSAFMSTALVEIAP